MIKVYEPLEYYDPSLKNFLTKKTIFLAGGIDRAPDWQKDAIAYLTDKYESEGLQVFNPRRSTPFTAEEYQAHQGQVKWEFDHLRLADVILFWFPDNAPCTTSLFEMGYWLNTDKVVVGINPGHYKERSVKTQLELLNASRVGRVMCVASSLEETLDQAVELFKHY